MGTVLQQLWQLSGSACRLARDDGGLQAEQTTAIFPRYTE